MSLIVDAGPLIALADSSESNHRVTRDFLASTDEALFLSPFALAEADYIVAKRLGVRAELALLGDVSRGSLTLESFDERDLLRAMEVIERYGDMKIRLADAAAVVLAHRRDTNRILTFDHRDFRVLRTLNGSPFVLLPADQP